MAPGALLDRLAAWLSRAESAAGAEQQNIGSRITLMKHPTVLRDPQKVGWNQLDAGSLLRHDAYVVVQYLHESAADVEAGPGSSAEPKQPLTEQRHQRRVAGQNADLPIVRGSDNRVSFALK